MIKYVKFMTLALLLFVVTPTLVNASFSDNVSKNILFSGGESVKSISTVNSEYINSFKIINNSTSGNVVSNIGASNFQYKSEPYYLNIFKNGTFSMKSSSGSYDNLGFFIALPNLIEYNGKTYNAKLSIKSFSNEKDSLVSVSSNSLGIDLRDFDGDYENNYKEITVALEIYDQKTGKNVNIPGVMFSFKNISNVGETSGIRITDFSGNKGNTFINNFNTNILFNSGSYYSLSNDNSNIYFKSSKFEKDGIIEFTCATLSKELKLEFSILVPKYEITYLEKDGSDIRELKKEEVFEKGNPSGYDIESKEGYNKVYWTCDKDVTISGKVIKSGEHLSMDEIKNIEIVSNYNFTAHFDKVKFNISTDVLNGSIDSSIDVYYGDDKTISFIPKEGYHLDKLIVDNKEIDIKNNPTSYTFSNINDNHYINAIFSINKYKITTSAVGGTIDNTFEVNYGDNAEVNFYPSEGYKLYSVKVDGVLVDYPKYYELLDVRENHTIEVVYELIPEIKVEKNTEKENYKENDIVNYRLILSQLVKGAIARDVVLEEFLPKGTMLDEESLKHNGFEVLSVSDNYFKIKIPEISDKKQISYNMKINSDIDISTLENKTNIQIGNLEEVITTNKKVYIPRGKIKVVANKKNAYYDDAITYRIDVSQLVKGANLNNVKIINEVPNDLEIISVKSNSFKTNIDNNRIIGQIKSLSDENKSIIITCKVKSTEGKIRNVVSLESDEIVYPLYSDYILNILKPKIDISFSSNKKEVKPNEEVKYKININGTGAREVSLKNIIPNNLELIKSSIKTTGKIKIDNNILYIFFDRIDKDTSITYKVKAKNVGIVNNNLEFSCINIRDKLNIKSSIFIENNKINKIKKNIINIPDTLSNKSNRFTLIIVFITLISMLSVIILVIKIKK